MRFSRYSSQEFAGFTVLNCLFTIDLFTDTAAILNSIVLTEELWAAEGAIAGIYRIHSFQDKFLLLVSHIP